MACDRRPTRRDLITAGTSATALAMFPIASSRAQQSVPTSEVRDMRLGVFPITDAAVLLLGADQGIFARNGIKLSVTTLSTASIVQSTISGQVDIALNSLQHSVSAAAAGLPLAIVSGLSVWAQGPSGADPDGLIVLKDGPTTGAELNGKTIAVVALNSADELAARITIDKHGGDSKSLRFTVLPPAAMRGALLNGDVQAAVVHDPFYSSFVATGSFAAPFGNPNFQAFPDLPRLVLITSRDYAGAHEAEIAGFRAAIKESIGYTLGDLGAIPGTLMKWFNTPEADAKASALPKLRAEVTVDQVAAVKRLSEQYSFLKGTVDPAALVLTQ
ncbi:ABC transporter substrate-binding protein [Inquilinus limosus]|uniref:ABC transporter substrate-binding protein n=1 Tax=Inquilinus limosus TaxID=171674 RepID=UPI003F15C7F8